MTDLMYQALMFLAGFIDSIAGGGGLITLPVFTILVGPGPSAIGTNKIIATAAASAAFINYARKGHFHFKIALPFFLAICVGALTGSRVAYLIPISYFRFLIIVACPLLLYLILNKKSFLHSPPTSDHILISYKKLVIAGLLCGLYDGAFGPGGGTIMLISLITWARLPLMMALACSKFANVVSALSGLTGYAIGGSVHWAVGIHMMIFAFVGAIIGSHYANGKAEKIVKPVLVLVVAGLLVKLLLDQFYISN
jgi:uncharacterized membrane protein YfcA